MPKVVTIMSNYYYIVEVVLEVVLEVAVQVVVELAGVQAAEGAVGAEEAIAEEEVVVMAVEEVAEVHIHTYIEYASTL